MGIKRWKRQLLCTSSHIPTTAASTHDAYEPVEHLQQPHLESSRCYVYSWITTGNDHLEEVGPGVSILEDVLRSIQSPAYCNPHYLYLPKPLKLSLVLTKRSCIVHPSSLLVSSPTPLQTRTFGNEKISSIPRTAGGDSRSFFADIL